MKQNEENKDKPAVYEKRQLDEITSDTIENAHASGDGAVQKSDELLSPEENTKEKESRNPY